jgi:hypothetical protein
MNLDVPVRPTIVAIGLIHAIQLGLNKLDREKRDLIGGPASKSRIPFRCSIRLFPPYGVYQIGDVYPNELFTLPQNMNMH